MLSERNYGHTFFLISIIFLCRQQCACSKKMTVYVFLKVIKIFLKLNGHIWSH
ncbi:MAG: hypothetical protein ACKPKO_14610 [Candidatus Fonsibacter sp.]